MNTHDENCFVAICERLKLNPWKDRYFRKDISRLTGYEPATIDKWSQNIQPSPLPIYKDSNNHTFCFRNDLVVFLQNIERVGINCKEMKKEHLSWN